MGSEIKDDHVSSLRVVVGFLPLAFGCFLAVLFQRIDSIVADHVATDLALGEGPHWVVGAALLLAFAASLLPSGIAIDRFGPRTVQSVMMGVTALGALIFSLSGGSLTLAIGRTLLGVGTASALLAAMKAVVAWSPRERVGLATGCLLAVAALGGLAAAGPAARFVNAYGWGSLYVFLAFLATIGAVLTALLVPAPATVAGDVPDRDQGLSFVLRDPMFGRFVPLAAIVVGTLWAIQSEWVVGWIAVRNRLEVADIIGRIDLIAIGQIAGSLLWGALADWAFRRGISAASVLVGAVALSVVIQFAAVVGIVFPTSIVRGAFLIAGAAVALPFVALLMHFPRAYAARACASFVVLQYLAALIIQSVMGNVVGIWPLTASGQTSAAAYALAFVVPIALQFAALAWFLFGRSPARDGAQNIDEIIVALASIRSAAQPLIGRLGPLLGNRMQRQSAAQAQPHVQDLIETTSAPVERTDTPAKPIDTPAPVETDEVAAAPAERAEARAEIPAASDGLAVETVSDDTALVAPEPSETVEAQSDTPAESTGLAAESGDTADETAETAIAPAEAVTAPAEAAVEPDSDVAAPREAKVASTESALQSMLSSSLSFGLRTPPAPTSRASADTSNEASPDSVAEITQPQANELSFPQIAPSHVQALNAVYRRRPALVATIGGRQASIAAAWPQPDRRRDATHRLTLRLDGEPGELWLPQSLLDILIGSVDPALSLDRLGPERAAIILEFALDSALTAIEMESGCKLTVDSFSGQAERPENDGQLPVFFSLAIEGLVTAGCELRIPPDYALRLAEALDRHAGISRSALDVPVPVCLRVAAANLAVGEVERLAPDDVVLVEATVQSGHAVIAVIGERLVAPVALTPEGHRLAAQPMPGATSPWAWSMPTDAVAAWESDAETDNRPLHVLFEIGRFELPASKVKQLAPSALLPLGPSQDQTVDIVVGGQRIGRGTLMQIGNRTGVRITTVRERVRPARAPAEEQH